MGLCEIEYRKEQNDRTIERIPVSEKVKSIAYNNLHVDSKRIAL